MSVSSSNYLAPALETHSGMSVLKSFIPSCLNRMLLLWHRQLIMYALAYFELNKSENDFYLAMAVKNLIEKSVTIF